MEEGGGTLRRKWFKNRESWQAMFPWLDAETDKLGRFGLGCLSCRRLAVGCSSPSQWMTFQLTNLNSVQISTFKRHQETQSHKEGMAKASGTPGAGFLAPTAESFAEVLDAVQAGKHSLLASATEKRMTFRKMLFCLAEAARDNLRAALRRAVSASVQQDVRKAQLLLRITCCDEGLRVTSAALGQCDLAATGFGQSAVGLMQGTMYIMTKLCTPLLCVPGRACTTQEPDVDMELLTHVRESVTLFAADGAGDEQLAGELSKVEIFPKMLFKMRDQCHGPCCVCYAIRDRRAQAKALSSMRRKKRSQRGRTMCGACKHNPARKLCKHNGPQHEHART